MVTRCVASRMAMSFNQERQPPSEQQVAEHVADGAPRRGLGQGVNHCHSPSLSGWFHTA